MPRNFPEPPLGGDDPWPEYFGSLSGFWSALRKSSQPVQALGSAVKHSHGHAQLAILMRIIELAPSANAEELATLADIYMTMPAPQEDWGEAPPPGPPASQPTGDDY